MSYRATCYACSRQPVRLHPNPSLFWKSIRITPWCSACNTKTANLTTGPVSCLTRPCWPRAAPWQTRPGLSKSSMTCCWGWQVSTARRPNLFTCQNLPEARLGLVVAPAHRGNRGAPRAPFNPIRALGSVAEALSPPPRPNAPMAWAGHLLHFCFFYQKS